MKNVLLFISMLLMTINMMVAQTWTGLPCPQNGGRISTCDSNVIWFSGSLTTGFSISSDKGLTWIHKNFPTSFTTNGFSLGELSAVNANTAYIIVSTANDQALVGLYKTTDAGDTWARESSIFNDPISFPDLVYFWNQNQGVAIGDGFEIYVYTSGEWSVANTNNASGYTVNTSDYIRAVNNAVYILTDTGKLLKGSNFGNSWSLINTPYSNISNLTFDFKDDNNGIVSSNNGTTNSLYRTTNGGINWTQVGTNISNLYNTTTYSPAYDRYYSIGRGTIKGLSYSTDNGLTWVAEPAFVGLNLGEMENLGPTNTYLGGQNVVYSLGPALSVTDENLKPQLSLFPNPTKDYVTILNADNIQIESMTIINMVGQQIEKHLQNDRVDLSTLPNGIYFLRIDEKNGNLTNFRIFKN